MNRMEEKDFVINLLGAVEDSGGVVPTAPGYRLVIDQYGITCSLPTYMAALRKRVGPSVQIARCGDPGFTDAYLAEANHPVLFGFYRSVIDGKPVLKIAYQFNAGVYELVNEWNTGRPR